jgi:hypothetical protein
MESGLKLASLTLVALLAIPAIARADSINFTGVGKSQVVTIAGLGSVYAGELNWTGLNQNFYSYCVDLWSYLQAQQQVDVSSTDGMAGDGGEKAAWLFNKYAEGIHWSTAAESAAMAAGLQMAIWEVVADGTGNLTSGAFAVTLASAQALGYAHQFLGALFDPNSGYQTAVTTWLDVKPGAGQDQIARVPEPATQVLFGIGLFAAAMTVRRRTQKA